MKIVLKSGKEQDITVYEETYNDSHVYHTIGFLGGVDIRSIITSFTEDELSEAKIIGNFGEVVLPALKVFSGYRMLSDDSIPNASIQLEEV